MQPHVSNGGVNAAPASAQIAVMLSYVSYLDDAVSAIGQYLPGWSVVWNGLETEDGNYAFVAKNNTNDTYALAIRGSLPVNQIFKNWYTFANWIIEDFDVVTTVAWPYSTNTGSRIANGTNTAFNNIIGMQDSLGSGQDVTQYLINNVYNADCPLIITGHSL